MLRILLADDEDHIRHAVALNLELEGYEVVQAVNGKEAITYYEKQHFDLILLDVMMPELDGFQVCELIRLKDHEIPIIFLTAKDTSPDRIRGLKRGGDDYLTKPFHLEELLLRVQNLLKRSGKRANGLDIDTAQFGGNEVNFKTFEVKTIKGQIRLTKKETLLLKLLIEHENEVVSRQQILQSVWGYDVYPTTRTIDNFILAFRKYFEADPANPSFFHSIRGVGYKFTSMS